MAFLIPYGIAAAGATVGIVGANIANSVAPPKPSTLQTVVNGSALIVVVVIIALVYLTLKGKAPWQS